jgi:hypothetical protein
MENGSVELAKEDFMLAAMNAGRKQGTDPKTWTIGTYVFNALAPSFYSLY